MIDLGVFLMHLVCKYYREIIRHRQVMRKFVNAIDVAMTAIRNNIVQQAQPTKDPEEAKKEIYDFYLDGQKLNNNFRCNSTWK